MNADSSLRAATRKSAPIRVFCDFENMSEFDQFIRDPA